MPGGTNRTTSTWDAPIAGSIVAPPGIVSYVRIPVPGTVLPDLPRGMVLTIHPPANWNGTTTAVFIRNPEDTRYGKPGLRLDYGKNRSTGRIDYHWNVEGGARARVRFPNITNHMPAGAGGEALYWAARAFRVGGRIFVVTALAIDIYSIVVADRPFRRVVQVVSAWGGAALAATQFGRLGAGLGTLVEPGLGTAIGGGLGAIAGGFIGYFGAERASGYLFDFAEGTIFAPQPELPVPRE